MFRASPSPEGRGCREAAGEGYHMKKYLFGTPHPVLRTTLSLRERDSAETSP
jgi:hypothetical protein